jgi:hypothetical protein
MDRLQSTRRSGLYLYADRDRAPPPHLKRPGSRIGERIAGTPVINDVISRGPRGVTQIT